MASSARNVLVTLASTPGMEIILGADMFALTCSFIQLLNCVLLSGYTGYVRKKRTIREDDKARAGKRGKWRTKRK